MKKKVKPIPLASLRSAKGLSQKAFAKEIHVSTSLIGMYESGKRKPSLKNALKIANYFNVPVENISFENAK